MSARACTRRPAAFRSLMLLLSLLWLTACVATVQEDADLAQAIYREADALALQLNESPVRAPVWVVDPFLDRRSGQQTVASQRFESQLVPLLAQLSPGTTIVPFDEVGAAQARFVVTGSISSLPRHRHRLSVSVVDRQTGLVIAHASRRVRQPDLDATPTRFYQDSPSLLLDGAVHGYLHTAETQAGLPADTTYLAQVGVSALLASGARAYQAGDYAACLGFYEAALKLPTAQQLRTFNGLYLCRRELGQSQSAEDAFHRIAMLGFANNSLALKLRFEPASSALVSDPQRGAAYSMWLRQVALSAQAAGSCLEVVAHDSKGGDDGLGVARATAVRSELSRAVPELADKTRVLGGGSSQNLVGSGARDASDEIDRRVEFRLSDCPR